MRSFWTSISAMAAAASLTAAMPAGAATMLDVNWNSDCGKSSCFNDKGVFTQTWSAADSHGPMTISQFLLDRGVLGALDGQTFRISFSIGGQEVGTWGKYNMGAIGGDELHFSGDDFVWNPEDGDLVLTLEIVGGGTPGAGGGGGSFFAAPKSDPPPSTDGPSGGDGPSNPNQGGFGGGVDTGPVSVGAVPEPAAWAMMISGFGLAGASLRRRRALTA